MNRRDLLKLGLATLVAGGGCGRSAAPVSADAAPAQSADTATNGDASPLGRITFLGNPWPRGHAIEDFTWTGRIDPETGLWFQFHLQSADYDAEAAAADDDEARSDWETPRVWQNYQRCTISPGARGGFLVQGFDAPLDLNALHGRTFRVDTPPVDLNDERRAFDIHLLGDDAAVDHEIRFTQSGAAQSDVANDWAIDWRGRLALTFAGDDELRYGFHAAIQRATLSGISLPQGTSRQQAHDWLRKLLVQADRYELFEIEGRPWFKPRR